MGWHRREPGQPLNRVFVSLATCSQIGSDRGIPPDHTSLRTQGDWQPLPPQEYLEWASPSCAVMRLGTKPALGIRQRRLYYGAHWG